MMWDSLIDSVLGNGINGWSSVIIVLGSLSISCLHLQHCSQKGRWLRRRARTRVSRWRAVALNLFQNPIFPGGRPIALQRVRAGLRMPVVSEFFFQVRQAFTLEAVLLGVGSPGF